MNPGPGRGPTQGGNNSVISVIMLRTILFPKQCMIGREVVVCHIYRSLRILVDGFNNTSILTNRIMLFIVLYLAPDQAA